MGAAGAEAPEASRMASPGPCRGRKRMPRGSRRPLAVLPINAQSLYYYACGEIWQIRIPEVIMADEPQASAPARYLIWYLLAAILVLLVFQMYSSVKPTTEISYSEFRHLLQTKGIDDLTIYTGSITGKLLPAGVEDLAKERKEPDLPQKLAQLSDKKEPRFTVARLEDKDLVPLLEKQGIKYSAAPDRTTLNNLLSWGLPILLLVGIWIYFFRRVGASAGGLMAVGKSRAKVYVQDETKTTFQDVAGVDEAIEELKEIIEFLKNPAKFQLLGGKIPKGVLLVGPPGTGKTLLARAVAG